MTEEEKYDFMVNFLINDKVIEDMKSRLKELLPEALKIYNGKNFYRDKNGISVIGEVYTMLEEFNKENISEDEIKDIIKFNINIITETSISFKKY